MATEDWERFDREAAHRYIAEREIQCRQYYANLLNRIGLAEDNDRTFDAANKALSSSVERLRDNVNSLEVSEIESLKV